MRIPLILIFSFPIVGSHRIALGEDSKKRPVIPDDVRECYYRAIDLFDDVSSKPWHWRSVKDYDHVAALCQSIIDRQGQMDSRLRIGAARLLVKTRRNQARYPEMMQAISKLLDLIEHHRGPSKAALELRIMADRYFNAGGLEMVRSKELFNILLQRYPNSQYVPEALSRIAEAHNKTGQWEEALDIFNRLRREYPESEFSAQALEKIKSIYIYQWKFAHKAWKYDAAMKLLQRAQMISNDPKFQARISFYVGLTRYNWQHYSEALKDFQKALACDRSRFQAAARRYIEKIRSKQNKGNDNSSDKNGR